MVFDGEGRPVAAMLRPAKRPSGHEARAFLRRLVRAIRSHWPRVEITLRGDSHYCAPEVLDLCRAEGLRFLFGRSPGLVWKILPPWFAFFRSNFHPWNVDDRALIANADATLERMPQPA